MADSHDIENLLTQKYRPYVEAAKIRLREIFRESPDSVFYERRLKVWLEDSFSLGHLESAQEINGGTSWD